MGKLKKIIQQWSWSYLIFPLKKQKILNFVNSHIKDNQKDRQRRNHEFYDIQLKIQKNWHNFIEVFKQKDQIHITHTDVQVRIVSTSNKLIDYRTKLDQCNKNLQNLKIAIKKDIEQIEKDNMIDIAFLYSEPLMRKQIPFIQAAVGYLKEIKKLEEKIKNVLSIKGTNKFNIKRSTKIQIHVLTNENLQKVLEKGVKFLHFATHGLQNYFQIEKSSEIGQDDILNYGELIKKLEKNPPQLIVFNCCLSFDIAKSVFEHFNKKQQEGCKPIVTIGYHYEVDNLQCEFISEILYTQIFKQEIQFKEIYKRLNGQLEEKRKMSDKRLPFKPDIFFNKEKQIILFKTLKIKQNQKYVEIQKNLNLGKFQRQAKNSQHYKKQTLTNEEKEKKKNYIKSLYIFIKKLLEQYKGAVNVFGLEDNDFVEKAIEYLWERKRIEKRLIFDCKIGDKYQIQSALQFRCKFKQQLQRSNIEEREKCTNVRYSQNKIKKKKIVVIKNCQKLLKPQQIRSFLNVISFFMKNFSPNILLIVSKQDFTKSFSANQPFSTFNARLYLKHTSTNQNQQHECEYSDILTNQQEQRGIKKIKTFQSHYVQYIRFFAKQITIKFLAHIPLINLFPQQVFKKQQYQQNSFVELNIHSLRDIYDDQILKYLSFKANKLIKQMAKNANQERIIPQLYQILRVMHLIAGFHFLDFQDLGSKHKKNCQSSIYQLINLCLRIKSSLAKPFDQLMKIYTEFQIKMTYIIYLLHIETQFQSSEQVIKEIKDTLTMRFKEITISQEAISMKKVLKIWDKCRSLLKDVRKKAELSDLKYTDYSTYFEQVVLLKKSIQNQKKYQNNWRLLSIQDAKFFMLPVLNILREEVIRQQMSNSLFHDCLHIKKLNQILKNFLFLEKDSLGIFETINKDYILIYIEVKADIQKLKLKLKHNQYFQYMKQIESIQRFNKWIQISTGYKMQKLINYLNKQKYATFNLFLTMEVPPFAFRQLIFGTMNEVLDEIKRDIFLKFQTFSIHNLSYYKNLKISIPVSLFILDVSVQKQKDYLIMWDDNTKQEQSRIQNLFKDFESYVGIFCGKNVKKVGQVLVKNKNFKFCISIQTNIIMQDLLEKQILRIFYKQFCKAMFQIHGKRKIIGSKQVRKSFQIALLRSKLKCLTSYSQYSQTIDCVFDNQINFYQNDSIQKNIILPVMVEKSLINNKQSHKASQINHILKQIIFEFQHMK